LSARTAIELAIAEKKGKGKEEDDEAEGALLDSQPLRIRGGGNPDEKKEEEPFMGFEDLEELEEIYIEEKLREIVGPEADKLIFTFIEDGMTILLDSNRSRQNRECQGKLIAYLVRELVGQLDSKRLIAEKLKRDAKWESNKLLERVKEDKEKIEELENKLRDKVTTDKKKKDESTQTQEEHHQQMEIGNEEEGEGEGIVLKRLEEVLERVKVIEEMEKKKVKTNSTEVEEDTIGWSKVIGRKDRNRNIQERRKKEREKRDSMENTQETRDKEEEKRAKNKEEENRGSRKTSLQALRRTLPKGAGVLLELRGGTQQEYREVLKSCQDKISLEELGIPPIGLRKARGGGILLEVRCGSDQEEKARQLADRMKEVVGSVEGAKVRCPLRRLRLKLSGLPFSAVASEIADAVARLGGGRADSVRVGPLRTSWSGAGSAWVVCPAEMAVRAAGAAELTLGWARVGVTMERGGPPQCHRCLARGHLRRWCPSGVSRGACCLRCGKEGHQIGRCGQKPHCPVCEERGLQADHRPGDPSVCRPVPPGVDREERSPRERPEKPPSPGPVEGPGGGVKGNRGASAPGGDLSPPGAEAPSSLDPGEGSSGVGRGPMTGPGDAPEGRPSGRLWGIGLSSGDEMEVEELRYNLKRKGQGATELKECSVTLAPLPLPKREGKGKKKKK